MDLLLAELCPTLPVAQVKGCGQGVSSGSDQQHYSLLHGVRGVWVLGQLMRETAAPEGQCLRQMLEQVLL